MSHEPYKTYLKSFESIKIVTDAPKKYTFFKALKAVAALAILVTLPFAIFISLIAFAVSLF